MNRGNMETDAHTQMYLEHSKQEAANLSSECDIDELLLYSLYVSQLYFRFIKMGISCFKALKTKSYTNGMQEEESYGRYED